ncbi:MAG: hypothetical protein Q9184_002730 [Pyrenodesmia sp. 2 TL-2023]
MNTDRRIYPPFAFIALVARAARAARNALGTVRVRLQNNTTTMAPSSALISKLKVQLKLAISRLRMVQQKDTAIAKQQRRQMAQLLEVGKEESARIRVENIIRSDITTELLEILELYCELVLARIGLLEPKECDPGLEEPIKSIIHAAPRTDVKELQQARQLLVEKYGKDFALEAVENSDGKVAERVLKKLKVEPPDPELVTLYLREIARTYGVDWPKGEHRKHEQKREDDGEGDDDPAGGQAAKNLEAPLTTEELNKATPPRDLGPKSPVSIAPPSPSIDNLSPRVKLPAPPELKPGVKMSGMKKQTPTTQAQSDPKGEHNGDKKSAVGGKIPDADELARRESVRNSSYAKTSRKILNMSEHKASGRWADSEKLALMISIIASMGTPNWNSIKLPPGRTKYACVHVYNAAMKEAQTLGLGDSKNVEGLKKRAPKNVISADTNGTTKRKRGKKGEQAFNESEASGDEDRVSKKLKSDEHSEEEKEVKLEADEV